METKVKKLKKLSLKKEIVSSLNNQELQNIKGGWTTSFGNCSGNLVCCMASDTKNASICISVYF